MFVFAAACAPGSSARVAGDGELVLELGGAARSLAGSLQKLGVELLPTPEPLPAPAPQSEPKPNTDAPQQEPQTEPIADPRVPAKPDPSLATDLATFEVALGANETLMDVASKHLGTAKRFKELMTLNGLTERDTRRLKQGQKIKVPKAPRAAAPR